MSKKGLPVWLIVICLILVIYIIFIGYLLFPYLIMYFKHEFVIESNDLPSYKEVFNSIFLVAQIIITSILTYLLYRTAENQRMENYEINNTKIASYLFYELKFSLVGIITSLYINNIENIIDEEIMIENIKDDNREKKSARELISNFEAFRKFPIKDFEKMKSNLSEITHLLGKEINERDLMDYYLLIIDLENASFENSDAFVYVLNDNCNKLIGDEKVGSKMLYREFYNFLFKNDFTILNKRFKKLFKRLDELKKIE